MQMISKQNFEKTLCGLLIIERQQLNTSRYWIRFQYPLEALMSWDSFKLLRPSYTDFHLFFV